MRYTLLFVCSLLTATCCLAQHVKWLETEHDFGVFQEIDGKQSYDFRFVNDSDKPVSINNVRTSCGCTAAKYPRTEVIPGDTASITVTYDPLGMMGRFEKTAKVYLGEKNAVNTLYIKGKVLTDGKYMAAKYPYAVGQLHLNRDSVWLGDVVQGSSRNEYIHAYNSSPDTLKLGWINDSKSLLLSTSQHEVAPGDLVTINVYYNSIAALEPGVESTGFTLLADEQNHPEWRLHIPVGANVVPQTDNLTPEQRQNAPVITYSPMLIDLGKVKADKVVNIKFKITNEGKNTLELYRIYATDLATACPLCPIKNFKVNRFPERVKPGKTIEVSGRLWLNEVTQLNQGAFNLMIEVKSNDPRNPRTIGNIHITGQISK